MKINFKSFTLQSIIISILVIFMMSQFIVFLVNPSLYDGALFDGLRNTADALANSIWLPIIILSMPLISGFLRLALDRFSLTLKDEILLIADALIIAIIMMIYPNVLDGGLRYEVATVFNFGLSLQINLISYLFILLAALLWFFIMMYAHEYMKKEKHTRRFFIFLSLSYTATMGIFMSGDLLTLFFLYEMMTLSTYILVVHSQNKTAIEAGTEYLFLGILGGFAIFIAMTLIYPITGSFAFEGAHQLMMSEGIHKYLIAGLLLIGFGMKAGMVPLHVWLPKAHPVAPAPASSLLSGIMIKVGVFGLIQSFIYFYLPADFSLESPQALGAVLIWISLGSMVFGAFMAFIQDDMKRLLAYSSISQVGFVILGIGIAMVQGEKGGPGLAGALMHGFNHALFKALLFMVAGMVYLKAHEIRMSALGGLRKKMPITATVSIIASLAVMGMPLFNGYASKTILHHALTDAAYYQSSIYYFAEALFILASIGTVAYFLKFNLKVFFGTLPKKFESIKFEARSVYAPMLMMALSLILLGIFPVFTAEVFILPYLKTLSFDDAFTVYGVLEVSLFGFSELLMIAGIWASGLVVYRLSRKVHMDEMRWPDGLNLEFLLLLPLSALLHGLLRLIDADHKVMDLKTYESYRVNNFKRTFKDHLVAFTDVLNKKYEALFIQSDALIYAIGLTAIVIILTVLAILN